METHTAIQVDCTWGGPEVHLLINNQESDLVMKITIWHIEVVEYRRLPVSDWRLALEPC